MTEREASASPYQAGVCNIGAAEIERRRRVGHVGVGATAVVTAALIASRAPRAVRFVVVIPATLAASGYLQAHLRFCAGFGSRGVFNFGSVGELQSIEDEQALRLDRARAMRIGVASAAIGAIAGATVAALPR